MKNLNYFWDPLQHLHGPPRGHDPLVEDHWHIRYQQKIYYHASPTETKHRDKYKESRYRTAGTNGFLVAFGRSPQNPKISDLVGDYSRV